MGPSDPALTVPPQQNSAIAALPETGAGLFLGGAHFKKGVVDWAGLPPGDRGEVALAGRSNVGKSSLLNALTGRRALARTSNTPGRTREVNFFDLAGQFYLVDLPGYGYAKASKAHVAKWASMTRAYLLGRASLKRVYQLVDARHGLKAIDGALMDALDAAAVSYQVVLTKADKIGRADAEAVRATVAATLAERPAAYPEVLLTSAEKKQGIEAFQNAIFAALER